MTQVDRVVRMLDRMQRDIRDLQTQPQLGNSALDGGINLYDPDGTLKGRLGDLPDGTHGIAHYNGVKPPTPTKPIVTPAPGGLTITWDGGFVPDPKTGEPQYCPMDFSRVEVYIGTETGFYDSTEPILRPEYLRGTIESPQGGDCVVVPLAVKVQYVVLVCRNLSGVASDPSEEASGTPGSWVSDEEVAQIAADLAANKQAVADNKTALAQANVDIAGAFTSAANAKNIADIATGKADAATTSAGAAMTAANGKNKVTFASQAPSGGAVNDTWFNSAQDNQPYKWDGTQWVAQPFGNMAIGNLDAAKISTGYLSAARIVAGSLSGDKITANTLNGDRIIANTLNADRIIANTITGDKILANEIVGVHIRSRQIGADKIIVGSLTADELGANSVIAAKVDSYAITGKVVTSGTYRTGVSGQDRIEIIDQVAYDPYLGYNRSIRDTIRWIRGSDNALVGEIRGYMGDINAYGIHLNSHVEIGNLQSVIHQVGKRAANGQASTHDRVRAATRQCSVFAANSYLQNFYCPFEQPMDQAPTFVVATPGGGGGSGLQIVTQIQVSSWDANGFYGTVFYQNGAQPGAGTVFFLNYYAELVV